ncbi:MAG: hypothetical protein KatS3mg053_1767 [Candidatus Roseilinea sp.]|nr:MAG: hypothetical protein KatS3mg053_1767 [Candidatus Roseilinea sp.]
MEQATVQFRPLDLNDTISESAQLVLVNALTFLGAMLLTNLPILIWQVLALTQPDQWSVPPRYSSVRDIDTVASVILRSLDGFDMRLVASALVSWVVSAWQAGATVRVAARRYFGRAITAGDAAAEAWSRMPALLMGGFIPALIVVAAGWLSTKDVIGIVACAALLMVTYPFWLFVAPAVMNEGLSGVAAVRRSIGLAQRAYGYTLAVWLVLELLLFLASLIPFFMIGLVGAASESAQANRIATVLFGNLAAFVVVPFRMTVITLLYYDVRRRKEGRASVLQAV